MTIEIKPGAELDAAVAKACGEIPGVWIDSDGSPWTDYHGSDVRWRPSVDLNHAFAAAGKCGLLTPKNDTTNILVQSGDRWLINSQMRFQWGGMASPYETSSKTIGEGLTPALAICAAILKLKG